MPDRFDDERLSPDEEEERQKSLGLHLPPVITGPGRYQTRGGYTVEIEKVRTVGDYPCEGTLHLSGSAYQTHVQWTAAGYYRAWGAHPYDVVARV